jgi:hypothetical protein
MPWAERGDLHLAVRLQRHPYVGDERLCDDLLAAFAQARVPRRRFVEEAAHICGVGFAGTDVPGGAFGNGCNGAGTYATPMLSTILQLLPYIQEKLGTKGQIGAVRDLVRVSRLTTSSLQSRIAFSR